MEHKNESEVRALGFSISGEDSLKVEKNLPSEQGIMQFLDLLQRFGKGYLADSSEGSYNHDIIISSIDPQPDDTEECFQLNSIKHSSESQTSSLVVVSLSPMTSNLSLAEDDQSLNNDKHMEGCSLSLDSLSSNKGETEGAQSLDEQKVKPEHLREIKKCSEQEKFIQLESQSRTCDASSKQEVDKKKKHVTEDDASEAAPHVNKKTNAPKLQVGDAKPDEEIKQAISVSTKNEDLNVRMCDDQQTTSSFVKELTGTNCNETFLITENPESADHNETAPSMKEPDEGKSRSKQTSENDKRSKTEKDLKMLDDKQTLATKQNSGEETNFKSTDSDIEGDGAQNVVNERMEKINETTLHNVDPTLLGPNSYLGHHSKLVIHIHKADITKMQVGAIVNAANRKLQHEGGVTRAIADAAGWKLDEDCKKYIEKKSVVEVTDVFVSTGGNLPAKYVLHAVGPKWDAYENKRECLNDLRCTVLRCLVVAESLVVTSIALPSISAAIFKVPKKMCVENYMEAVKHFDEYMKGKKCTLKEIHFVDVDDIMVNLLAEQFKNHWDEPCSCGEKDKDFQFAMMQLKINKNDSSQSEDDAVMPESTNNNEASFVKELPRTNYNETYLTNKESADHNETFPSMKGPDEGKSRGKQKAGNDQRSKTEKNLKMLDDKQTSAIKQNTGVGTHFKSIDSDIKGEGAQHFLNERMEKIKETTLRTVDSTQLGPNSYLGHHSKLVIHIHKADITKMQVGAIVNAANRKLQHGGGVARAIADAAGRKLDEDCEKYIEKKSAVEVTDVFVSTGGNLPAKYVLHAVGPKWDDYEKKRECFNDLRCTVLRCLVVAESLGVTSIALPSISAAIFKVPKDMCAENYMEAVKHFDEYMKCKQCTLKEIHFVDVDDTMVNTVVEEFMNHWNDPCNCREKDKDFQFAEIQVKINKNDMSQREDDDTVMPENQPKTATKNQNRWFVNPLQSLVSNLSSSTSTSAKPFGNDNVSEKNSEKTGDAGSSDVQKMKTDSGYAESTNYNEASLPTKDIESTDHNEIFHQLDQATSRDKQVDEKDKRPQNKDEMEICSNKQAMSVTKQKDEKCRTLKSRELDQTASQYKQADETDKIPQNKEDMQVYDEKQVSIKDQKTEKNVNPKSRDTGIEQDGDSLSLEKNSKKIVLVGNAGSDGGKLKKISECTESTNYNKMSLTTKDTESTDSKRQDGDSLSLEKNSEKTVQVDNAGSDGRKMKQMKKNTENRDYNETSCATKEPDQTSLAVLRQTAKVDVCQASSSDCDQTAKVDVYQASSSDDEHTYCFSLKKLECNIYEQYFQGSGFHKLLTNSVRKEGTNTNFETGNKELYEKVKQLDYISVEADNLDLFCVKQELSDVKKIKLDLREFIVGPKLEIEKLKRKTMSHKNTDVINVQGSRPVETAKAIDTKPLTDTINSNTVSESQLSAFSLPFQPKDKKSSNFTETGSKMHTQNDRSTKMEGTMETRSHNADLTQLGSNSYLGHHSNIVIRIHKADITKMQMGAIVNAANRRLHHGGGVARAIADAAGWKLNEECKKYIEKKSVVEVTDVFVSTGGNLPAKYVLHAVGPKWDAYENKKDCLNDLRRTVLRCLVVAERLGVTSVALPSISAAIFKVPREICVENYMEAVKHFDEYMKGKKCTLKEIHFVDVDDTMINLLTEQFMDHWDKSCHCKEKEKDVYFAEMQVKINKNDTSQREDDAVMPESQRKTVTETQKQSLSKPVQSLVSNFSSATRSTSAKSFDNDDVYTFDRVEIEITNKPAFDLQADNVCTVGHVFDQLSGLQNFKAEQHIQHPDCLPRNKDMFEFVFLRKPGGSSDCLVCVLLPEPESMEKIDIVARNIEACVRSCGKESPLSKSKSLVMTSHLLFEDAKKKKKLISKLTQVIYDYAMKCSHHNTWEVKKIFISCSKTVMPAIKQVLDSRKDSPKTMFSGGTAPGAYSKNRNTPSTGNQAGEYRQNTGKNSHEQYFQGGQHDRKGRHSDTGSSVDPTSHFPSAYMGNQPDGRMTVTFQQAGYIEIVYDFPNGKQNNFHPNPGIWCNGTKRTAYLPLSDEGFHVLKLFRLAFLRRQTFTVDGKTNNIKWNGIFHKTELGEGKYGLQDPDYLPRVRRDLEKRGISFERAAAFEMGDLDMFSQSLFTRGYFSSMAG